MFTINGNAKINLTLDILGTRADGFHEVSMVMQEISLADTIELEVAEKISLEVSCKNGAFLEADETNLCYKAAKLIKDKFGLKEGVSIRLTKCIPIAAGLAGGSTDAAAVLKGMNILFKLDLSEDRLCELGAKLGSDIPFCLRGGTMLATGRGEILERLPSFADEWLVLAKPPIGVSTAWAYKTYDSGYVGSHPNNKAMIQAIANKDNSEVAKQMCNVLEGITKPVHSEIADYEAMMLENGAIASMMSGSGPTVFGLCPDEIVARKIAETMQNAGIQEVHVARTIGKE